MYFEKLTHCSQWNRQAFIQHDLILQSTTIAINNVMHVATSSTIGRSSSLGSCVKLLLKHQLMTDLM